MSARWEWHKSTVWNCTMRGFPSGWITITRDDLGSYRWEITLVDVDRPRSGGPLRSFADAKRDAEEAYKAMSAALKYALAEEAYKEMGLEIEAQRGLR